MHWYDVRFSTELQYLKKMCFFKTPAFFSSVCTFKIVLR